jgi:hypothetical protein
MTCEQTIKKSKFALIINLNKFNTYCEINHTKYICDSLEECKIKLIDYLVSEFKNLNIDFPFDILDFEYIYLNQNYINTNSFNYMIFSDNLWINPWDNQDIYSEVIDKIHIIEINECEKNQLNNAEYFNESDSDNSEKD